jgi:hypothetical protein
MDGEELRVAADACIGMAVACGRFSCVQIVEDTVDYLHGYAAPGDLRALAWRLIGPRFAEHLAAQVGWPQRTDSDRLTDAFRALDAARIVAREDFACCQNCGTGEIGGEVLSDFPARGYVFYHYQDAERAVGGGELWLAWGRFEASPDAELGAEIVAALRAQGLTVDWDGEPGMRIRVPMVWARRRLGRLAAYVMAEPGEREVLFEPPGGRVPVSLPVSALATVELPWLPNGKPARIDGVEVTRQHHLVRLGDGRSVGRFHGLSVFDGASAGQPPTGEPGVIEVTYETKPNGPSEYDGLPLRWDETAQIVRRMPTRTGSWLSALSPSGGIVADVVERRTTMAGNAAPAGRDLDRQARHRGRGRTDATDPQRGGPGRDCRPAGRYPPSLVDGWHEAASAQVRQSSGRIGHRQPLTKTSEQSASPSGPAAALRPPTSQAACLPKRWGASSGGDAEPRDGRFCGQNPGHSRAVPYCRSRTTPARHKAAPEPSNARR